MSVWLARLLPRADFGLYALGSTLLLLVGALFLGLLGEPISVFGAGKYRERFAEYLGVALVGWAITYALELCLFGVAAAGLYVGGRVAVAELTLVVGCVAPLVALLRTLRMSAYAVMRPGFAALATTLHLSSVLLVIATVPADRVTSTVGFGALGLGVLPAAVLLMVVLSPVPPWRIMKGFFLEVYRDHVTFGRWSVGANLLLWVPGNVVYFLLTSWAGVEAAGILKALRTLTTPIMHAIYALTSVLMPKLVAVRESSSHRRVEMIGLLLFVGLASAYWLALALGGGALLNLVYAGAYDQFSGYLTFLALGPVVSAVVAVLAASLRSLERPRDVFVGNAVAAVATLTLGALLISQLQLGGAVATIVGSAVVTGGTLAALEQRARASLGRTP